MRQVFVVFDGLLSFSFWHFGVLFGIVFVFGQNFKFETWHVACIFVSIW